MIKQYFTDNCISIRQWIKKHDLNERVAYYVISGEVVGAKNSEKCKKVFEALLSEGIIDEMPSAFKDDESQKAS
ncbi:hypothetical protein FFA43_01225 [Campylobacter hyointestinalis subsp. hyointestinalis]|uniref:hypothetical protein n=1 Tax=Campylobacter TaxID=194 RepID=UPI00072B5006|nr:hypothetical protein [Campylobacter hyointestinalis]MBE3022128.1 hypothetical protein [Campylobacter sp. 7477a]PPB57605.1 hypothetical protein CDQ71_06945 [Campylobacter hyointestinalis subsp. hyointestinalis]QCT99336.1 hypothetical protein FFA43_01225 [Campylobacter hyointestinalis subsp. hyointestinalis]CUU82018.1 Uncharacterised protein [Campylobacter hyointestinalis subsp. hyointestinalis]